MSKKLWKATGEIVKAFSEMRRGCNDEGIPLSAEVLIKFYEQLRNIETRYNIYIYREELVKCYYSFMRANIDNDRISYKIFRETLISLNIVVVRE